MAKVIEPSEIIVDQAGAPKESAAKVNPWIRAIARLFDYSLLFIVILICHRLFGGRFPFGFYERLIPFEFFVWIPIEALLLYTWGTTPGKFLLKTQLHPPKKLDFTSALKRSFNVWFRGIGMGVPIINIICMLFAYQRLKVVHTTSWDRDEKITVTHLPLARWRLILAIVIAFGVTLFYYSEKNAQLAKKRYETTAFF